MHADCGIEDISGRNSTLRYAVPKHGRVNSKKFESKTVKAVINKFESKTTRPAIKKVLSSSPDDGKINLDLKAIP